MRASRARWRPARFTSARKLRLLVLLHLFSNLFSSIDFAATSSASVSSSFNLDSREDVQAHMSFFFSKRPRTHPKTEVLLEEKCLILLKKTSQPRKKIKFCMKK